MIVKVVAEVVTYSFVALFNVHPAIFLFTVYLQPISTNDPLSQSIIPLLKSHVLGAVWTFVGSITSGGFCRQDTSRGVELFKRELLVN